MGGVCRQYLTADKAPFMEAVVDYAKGIGHIRPLGRSLEELSELCRRSRRIRDNVQEKLGFATNDSSFLYVVGWTPDC